MLWRELDKGSDTITPNQGSVTGRADVFSIKYNRGTKKVFIQGSVGRYAIQVNFQDVVLPNEVVVNHLSNDKLLPYLDFSELLAEHDIEVYCNCLSYKFRNNNPNRTHDAGAGRQFTYSRRKSNRKPYNPDNIGSACKHLIFFVECLENL